MLIFSGLKTESIDAEGVGPPDPISMMWYGIAGDRKY